MMSFVKKKTCEKDVVGIVTHQSHYYLYYNGIPELVRKRSMLTAK